ncbi:MAG: Flp family type IVb pilin [Alphaproteobacteria bacterium]|nr:Flp family type IVb pilin [Alphaproteobacteria bacterium]HPF46293.1 Flp family type IVb pilin [Emcibacteraceae bacterium]HRW29078.1 Flp family type IVb pilin [Emcibacteraceae bacterium]
MKFIRQKIKSLLSNETGATAIEYGLLVSLIALAITGALSTIGDEFSNTLTTVGTAIEESQN